MATGNDMKLLIVTQKIDRNDTLLGFMHRWVEEFARHCERVTVICLEQGSHALPDNVTVKSLGKENKQSRLQYLLQFYKYIWQERKNYDAVFVHMNQIYVVLGGWLWWMWRKHLVLWYAHGYTPMTLRIAEKMVHAIVTSTKSGCRLRSTKINVVGQGIDTDAFVPSTESKTKDPLRIVTVGRISPVKSYETLLNAIAQLSFDLHLDIIGGPGIAADREYQEHLRQIVRENKLDDTVTFVGPVGNKDILPYLHNADLFVNTSLTGSLDKAILEAMAAALPILTCNEALEEVLGEYQTQLMFAKDDTDQLAEKIEMIASLSHTQRESLGMALRKIVVSQHSTDHLIRNILSVYGSST